MMIKINRFYIKCAFVLIFLVAIVSSSVAERLPVGIERKRTTFDDCDSANLKPCTPESIKEYLASKMTVKVYPGIRYINYVDSFPRFVDEVNCLVCTAKKTEFKKILVVQYFELEKDTSELAKRMRSAIRTIIHSGGWSSDYERMLIQKAEDAKKKQDWPAYYGFVLELASYSPQQWFKYSMIYFHANDSIYSSGKRGGSGKDFHCLRLFKHLKETKDNGVSDTIVSVVYTMIKNETVMFTTGLDELLAEFSEEYRYSKQRMALLQKLDSFYEARMDEDDFYKRKHSFCGIYIDKVKKEVAKKKKLIDFVPPVKIE